MRLPKKIKLIICLLSCQIAGLIGIPFTSIAVSTWYTTLQKPFFSPPNWLFGPVWFILYLLMGISLFLIWESRSKEKYFSLKLFGVQLLLNAFWTPLFFGLKMPGLAFLELMVLEVIICWTIIRFYRIKRWAAYLMLPYAIWVAFALLLNLMIVYLN